MHTILTRGPTAQTATQFAQASAIEAVEAFRRKFAAALPGTALPYYTGFLCHDSYLTITDPKTGAERSVAQEPAKSLGDKARRLYAAGQAELLQRRIAPGTFQYLAVKRRSRAYRRADPE
jgi:hypothetical protein